jgi:hypothetical protein
MSAQQNDGGPAFPVAWHGIPHGGMTLRDWFAGQALAGLLTSPSSDTAENWASTAYGLADAMLAARSAKP